MKSILKLSVSFFVIVHILVITVTPSAAYATITNLNASGDTMLLDVAPTTNYGTFPLQVGFVTFLGTPRIYRSLLQFDLSSLPSGTPINEAHLYLYFSGIGGNYGTTSRTYSANRVTKGWVEGDGPPGTIGATWNDADKSVPDPWSSAGGDFTTTGAATVVTRIGSLSQVVGWYDWDVTAIVKAWIEDGQPNYGFLIKDLNEWSGSEYEVSIIQRGGTNQPRLEIDYVSPPRGSYSGWVGGELHNVNKLVVAIPFLALITVSAIATVYIVKIRHRI